LDERSEDRVDVVFGPGFEDNEFLPDCARRCLPAANPLVARRPLTTVAAEYRCHTPILRKTITHASRAYAVRGLLIRRSLEPLGERRNFNSLASVTAPEGRLVCQY